MSDWQSIKTAPAHQRVLLCDGAVHPDDFSASLVIGLWTDKRAGHVADDEQIWANWNAGMDEDDVWSSIGFTPTHWMPLPEPPGHNP